MSNFTDRNALLGRIKELYSSGGNVIQYLRSLGTEGQKNTVEDIRISYEFQSGAYTEKYYKDTSIYDAYTKALAAEIENLGIKSDSLSILEVGCGEATGLALLVKKLKTVPKYVLGFDISWSRIKFAKAFFKKVGIKEEPILFTADLFNIPLADNSVDIVYTGHTIESNGGREKEAVAELYRVAKRYVVLLEPAYEFVNEEGKRRMESFGYITRLQESIAELGYKVLVHRPFDVAFNPLNQTGLTIIEKAGAGAPADETAPAFTCPVTHTPLVKVESAYYSPESLLAYPILEGIPCLLKENALVAVHLQSDVDSIMSNY